MKRNVVLALLLALTPRLTTAATRQRVDLGVGLTTAYDSNLLQYSNDQLRQFEDGVRPERFSIETRDDLDYVPELSVGWELDSGDGRRHSLRLRGEGDFHQRNGTADFRAASLTWRESFRGERRLALGAYTLPHYYLRQLVDEDFTPPYPGLSRYRRVEFALDILSAGWSQRVSRHLRSELNYRFERRRYGADFRERDSGTHEAALTLDVTPRARTTVEVGGTYRVSIAKADDGDDTVAIDDVDLSYHGPGGILGGRMELLRRNRLRVNGDVGLEVESRDYDSDRSSDTYHHGRHDLRVAVETGLRLQIRRRWSARGFWRYESSNATLGVAAPASADVGSYRQHVIGIALDVASTLWRSTTARATGDEE